MKTFEDLDKDLRDKIYDFFSDWWDNLDREPSKLICFLVGFEKGMNFKDNSSPNDEEGRGDV